METRLVIQTQNPSPIEVVVAKENGQFVIRDPWTTEITPHRENAVYGVYFLLKRLIENYEIKSAYVVKGNGRVKADFARLQNGHLFSFAASLVP
jgi:hypothetical protein